MAACNSTNPCQTSLTPLSFGDCSVPADAGVNYGPPSRASCQDSCTSYSDQAVITGIFSCWNAIPADAGACAMASQAAWLTYVGGLGAACLSSSSQLSTPCLAAFVPDAG